MISVPTMLMSTTDTQYKAGTYRLELIWNVRAAARSTPMMSVVPVSPSFRLTARKSAAVSPTVVAMILMIQK